LKAHNWCICRTDDISYRIAPISLVKTARIPNQNRRRIHQKKGERATRTRGSEPKPRASAPHLQILLRRPTENSSHGSHVAVRERLPKRLEVGILSFRINLLCSFKTEVPHHFPLRNRSHRARRTRISAGHPLAPARERTRGRRFVHAPLHHGRREETVNWLAKFLELTRR